MALSPSEVDRALAGHPGWRRVGKTLIRDVPTRDFAEALRLVDCVGQRAVDCLRRPDMCISEFNRVRLTIVNSHRAGLTGPELRLAAKTSAVIDAYAYRESGRPAGQAAPDAGAPSGAPAPVLPSTCSTAASIASSPLPT